MTQLTWHGIAPHGAAWYGMAKCDMAGFIKRTARHSSARCGNVRHDTAHAAWNSTARCRMVRDGKVRHGRIYQTHGTARHSGAATYGMTQLTRQGIATCGTAGLIKQACMRTTYQHPHNDSRQDSHDNGQNKNGPTI